MKDIQSFLYRGIVRLHPAEFRERFGQEMLFDFEEAKAAHKHEGLLVDALLSLGKQWAVLSFLPATEASFSVHAGLLAGQYISIGREGLSVVQWLRGLAAATAFLGVCTFALSNVGHNRASAMQGDSSQVPLSASRAAQASSDSQSPSENAASPGRKVVPVPQSQDSGSTRSTLSTTSSSRLPGDALSKTSQATSITGQGSSHLRNTSSEEMAYKGTGPNVSNGATVEQLHEKPRAFEVISIRPSRPGSPFMLNYTPYGFVAKDMDLQPIIVNAYNLRDQQLITAGKPIPGGPAWINSDRFDIDAKMSEADIEGLKKLSDDEQLSIKREMLRTMLATRFNLKTHPKVGQQSCFALAVGKKGSKLTVSKAGEAPHAFGRPGSFEAHHSPISQLVFALSGTLHCPVVDETKLTGDYNYNLEYFPEQSPRMGAQTEAPNPSDNAAPSIFTAVQEQLGLKLVPRTVPVSSIVIDRVEKPSPN